MAVAKWSQEAENDLREIFRYIAYQDHRPEVARNIVQAIRKHSDDYATFHVGGSLIESDRSHIAPGLRSFTHQRWVVLFRLQSETIQVLAVFDSSREYIKLFQHRLKCNE